MKKKRNIIKLSLVYRFQWFSIQFLCISIQFLKVGRMPRILLACKLHVRRYVLVKLGVITIVINAMIVMNATLQFALIV